MYQLKRILIGLDFSEMDAYLLEYASLFVGKIRPEKIYFFAVGKKLKLPASLDQKYSGDTRPIEEILVNELQSRARDNFEPPENCEMRFEVKIGKALQQIREWSEIKEIDLIIMGRKVSIKGSGKLPYTITRSSHCSVLIVPENPPGQLETLLVPVNVASKENLPLLVALELHKKANLKLLVQSIYEVPTGYHYSGKSFEEFSEIMGNNARARMDGVKKRYSMDKYPIEYLFSFDNDHDLAEKIYSTALKKNVDMILMGSRGRTKTASLVLSSIAQRVTKYDKIIPLLIAKDKVKNLGFLDALKQL